jgi:hypothetical protein
MMILIFLLILIGGGLAAWHFDIIKGLPPAPWKK